MGRPAAACKRNRPVEGVSIERVVEVVSVVSVGASKLLRCVRAMYFKMIIALLIKYRRPREGGARCAVGSGMGGASGSVVSGRVSQSVKGD